MDDQQHQSPPPRIAHLILNWILRWRGREEYGPELVEMYRERARRQGPPKARLWYWRQTLGFAIRWGSIKAEDNGRLGRSPLLETLALDISFGLRTLKRRPLFTLVALATLALGIGSTTTIYSVVDAVLLRGLPYPEADRLVSIWTSRLNDRDEWVTESLYPPEYRELLAHASTLENVALYFFAGGSLQGQGDPMNLTVGEGTATLADVAGIQPQLGRWFRPEEVGPEKSYVTVLGDALWRERFGADPDVIGTTVLLEHHPYTVIGVMPPEFRFKLNLFQEDQALLSPQDTGERPVWVPSGHNYGRDWYYATEGWSFEALARLRPGVSLEAAQAEIETLVRGETPPGEIQLHIARRNELEVGGLPAQLLLLAIPSALLLLIACANVATLFLGESEGRKGELATRRAIGAGSGRIVRQLLTESVILGLAGSLAGFALATGATRVLAALAPASSAMETVEMNLSVLAFSSLAGVLAGIGFGLAPALSLGRGGMSSLTDSGRRLVRGRRKRTNLVVGLEVALTVALLITGGLFTRSLLKLTAVNMGFEPERLIAFRAAIDDGLGADERAVAYSEMITRMEAVPGVVEATGSWSMPLLMSLWTELVATETTQGIEESSLPRLSYDVVMPDYHETMGIPLLAGRRFSFTDGDGAAPVVIVSESTAESLWPDESAVGKRLLFGSHPDWHTVVGVVGDVRYGGLDSEPRSPIYRPYLQNPGQNGIRFVLTARTTVDPAGISSELEAAARSAYPSVLLREGRSMESVVSDTATDQRFRALLVLTFGLGAVVLAAVGIFGVVARGVGQRSRELAIRMALGAESGGLKAVVLGNTLWAAGTGAVVGLVAASWGSRYIQSYLFGVQASDGLTYLMVTVLVLLVCAAAGYLPASRILHLEPATVLKED